MKRVRREQWTRVLGLGVAFFASTAAYGGEQPTADATKGFDIYVLGVEARAEKQRGAIPGKRPGDVVIERLTPQVGSDLPGALLHHWRGTAFVAGVKAADFDRLMRGFSAYPRVFAPEVVTTQVLSQQGDRVLAKMRVRQKHVITVVMDTTYDVVFGRWDAGHGYCNSKSTRVAEIEDPGAASERTLSAEEEHGYLWRQNTYWSYEERDGGLYMRVESVSLSRSIPRGLGWAVGPFVESVPRESLEFTLRAVCDALRKP